MNVALYMDEHIHSGITKELRRRGFDVLTVQADGRTGGHDEGVLDRALELRSVVLTGDTDFLEIAEHRQATGATFAGIIYVDRERVSIRQCIQDLDVICTCGDFDGMQSTVTRL